jgi:cholesterol transport system auxiliary component
MKLKKAVMPASDASVFIANSRRFKRAAACFILVSGFLLAGCSVNKPLRSAMYDFGPGMLSSSPATQQAGLPALALDDVGTPGGALDNMTLLYRLAYTDEQQLRPYAMARWSMPPGQLVHQRLRDRLGQNRAIFSAGESAALNRSQDARTPMLLRADLEEFSHLFTAPATSVGLVRLRVSLFEVTAGGEKLVAQRKVVAQRPARSADAPGGVRALAEATDAAIDEIDQWLQQFPAR